jgi:putative aminopeptidase FrvX
MSDIKTISAMLKYCRPVGSRAEKSFIERFLTPLGAKKDGYGNQVVIVGSSPTVLWSSHTDTVHSRGGNQTLSWDGKFLSLPKDSKSDCLGADCTAGVFIMTEMIKAQVPGLYVFHYGEEVGCLGSRAIATHTPEFLDGIQYAIAFDRRGTKSIITHQGSRCCSDAFADSIKAQLPARYEHDDGGSVTDTRMYMGIVPECSNISVGFYNEHSPDEMLDTAHLFELRDHMLKIDVSKFVVARDPKVIEPKKKKLGQYSQFQRREATTIEDLVWENAREVAGYIEDLGVTFDELRYYIAQSQLATRLSA